MSGPIALGPIEIATAAALLGINALLSMWLRLGMERRLIVAALRSVVQLSLLGYVLLPVFEHPHAALVLVIVLLMVAAAAREAVRRSSRTVQGASVRVFVTLLVAGLLTTWVGTRLVVGVEPWWQPRYFIPLVGMVLGNAVTGISLGLDRCLTLLDEGRDRVEALLALGATRREAVRPVLQEAVRTGMVPIINAMSVVGIVAIPGMMTGQILGGTPPVQAARYQMLILFLIAAATALGVVGATVLAARVVFDEEDRLRVERITRRG